MCESAESIGHSSEPCNGFLIAQTFESNITGWIQTLSVTRCTASATAITIRELAPNASNILEGSTIYTSPLHPATAPLEDCATVDADLSHYATLSLDLADDSVAVSPGITYVLVFDSGWGAGSCPDNPYEDGVSLGEFGPMFDIDLIFTLEVCEAEPDEIVFGCTIDSPDVCNYDPLANANDGSCFFQDCMGVCGGTAHIVEGCGCVDGTSPLQESDCYGCTDHSACNFVSLTIDGTSFTPPFDDGSCAEVDCHGDCGGTAYLTSCGCIGGNTGIQGQCIDDCLTDAQGPPMESCAPYFMLGQVVYIEDPGILRRVGMDVCCATDAQFIIRELPEADCASATPMMATDTAYVSTIIPATCSGFTNCITPAGNITQYWNVADFVLEAGHRYVFELIQGIAGSRCESDDGFLESFDFHGDLHGTAMGLNLDICREGLGCADPIASNYDANATVDLPALCSYPDCAGIVDGPHLLLPGCGCTDTSDEVDAVLCIDDTPASVTASDGLACDDMLMGQQWTAPVSGYLRRIQLHANPTQEFQVTLTVGNGPLQGTTLAQLNHAAITPASPCGEDAPDWITLDADSVPVEAGRQYIITSSLNNLHSNCLDDYDGGHGIQQNGASAQDARFRVGILEDADIIWGCQDQSKCNYLSNATHDSGVCYDYDCLGQCPDLPNYQPATYVDLCGCVGGPDSLKVIDEENCFGCTDPNACNYGAEFISDDGSCNPRDCNGDCLESDPLQSGLAYYSEACGCVGGNVVDDEGHPVSGLTCSDRCQGNPIASNFDSGSSWSTYLSSGGIQSLTIDTTTHVAAIQLYQVTPPSNVANVPFTIEVAVGTSNEWSTATIVEEVTCTAYSPVDAFPGLPSYALYFPLLSVVDITPQTHLLFRLKDGNWACPLSTSDALSQGTAFQDDASPPLGNDLFLTIYGCDDLYGCTDPSACNFDDWATQNTPGLCEADCNDPAAVNYTPSADPGCTNNDYCEFIMGCTDPNACNHVSGGIETHPYTGHTVTCVYADSASCLFCPLDVADPSVMSNADRTMQDSDQDGICDGDEIPGCLQPLACNYHAFATDPAPCVYANECGECSGETDGTGYVILSNDDDNDGVCDYIDLCINLEADNYDSPLNEPCRGSCDSAPVRDTAYQVAPATDLMATDGQLSVLWYHGDMPGMVPEDLAVDRIHLHGKNGVPDVVIDANILPYSAPPGYYDVEVIDAEGCSWVTGTLHESTFQQPEARMTLIIGYALCCSHCNNHDVDADGICDGADNCADRNALNFSDPSNPPCIYPE